MATRSPLVLVGNDWQELPTGDTVGGISLITGLQTSLDAKVSASSPSFSGPVTFTAGLSESSSVAYIGNGGTLNDLLYRVPSGRQQSWMVASSVMATLKSAGWLLGADGTAARTLELLNASAAQQRWTNTAGVKYAEREVDSSSRCNEYCSGDVWRWLLSTDTSKGLRLSLESGSLYLDTIGGLGNFFLRAGSSERINLTAAGIGFFGQSPAGRQVVPTGSPINTVITALQNLGLFSQT